MSFLKLILWFGLIHEFARAIIDHFGSCKTLWDIAERLISLDRLALYGVLILTYGVASGGRALGRFLLRKMKKNKYSPVARTAGDKLRLSKNAVGVLEIKIMDEQRQLRIDALAEQAQAILRAVR